MAPAVPVELDTHAEAGYAARGRPDGLAVHRIAGVDPSLDVRRWVEAAVGIGGPPVVGAPERTGRLLDWHDEGASTAIVAHLGVDVAHASQWLDRARPELVRTYVVVARRGITAWKIELSLTTACPPGSPDSVVDVNDHVRAGVVLGNLQLLDDGDPPGAPRG